jgi:Cleaved Adhesin Domain.
MDRFVSNKNIEMNTRLLIAGALVLLAGTSVKAQNWTENFNAGFPSGWTLHNVDNLTPIAQYAYVTDAWVIAQKQTANNTPIPNDSVIVSTSWYNPSGTANDWVITHAFTVNSASTAIEWEEKAFNASYADGYEVRVSTTGTAVGDFTTVLYSTTGAATTDYAIKRALLGAFNGQTIYVAFRNNSVDREALALDNIRVYTAAANDAALTAITPTLGSAKAFGVSGSSYTLGGTLYNNGSTAIATATINIQIGSAPVVTQNLTGLNVAAFGTHNFTAPVTLPVTNGNYPVSMWVSLTNDVNSVNDTLKTAIDAVSYMPAKRLTIEEGTGTWCGWCPRGTVYMEELWNNHQSQVSLIAVHNGDPMVLSAYDNFMGPKIGGYPSALVDRAMEVDPGDLVDVFNAEKDNFGYADITVTNLPAAEFGFSVKASVKPALDLSGDYRLALVLTEDDAHGTTAKWAQANYYSYQSANQPLVGAGFDWQQEPDKVPADKMFYDFVARHVVPNPNGAAGSLPATMTAGNTYDYTFNTTITPGLVRDKMRAIVMLIRNSDGHILNSNFVSVPVGVSDVKSAVTYLNIYPNPTMGNATISFNLTEGSKVNIVVVDAMGRVVKAMPEQQMIAGEHKLNLTTVELANGIYNVKIQTEKGIMIERLSVIK